MTTPEATYPCLACEAVGEIGTSQDYFGNWNTVECRACVGLGEVQLPEQEQREQIAAAKDAL